MPTLPLAQLMRKSGLLLILTLVCLVFAHPAAAALTVIPSSWDIVGLDSNTPATGPQHFPVGVRVCSDVATSNVAVNFVMGTGSSYINLSPGIPTSLTIATIGANQCASAYFEVQITRDAAAFHTFRTYTITATDSTGTASSPTPRQLYVEQLISQNRNAVSSVVLNGNTVPQGGAMNLVVGNTYDIVVNSTTATQGYQQLENFFDLPGNIFQVLSVASTYSANTAPAALVPVPNPSVYANACGWDANPSSLNYNACVAGDYKAGGTVTTTYSVKIIGGAGTSTQLNTLIYDFSGSSFHYNADFSTNTYSANIQGTGFTKAFSAAVTGGISKLTFTITNPTASTLSGVNFLDTLPTSPGAMVVAPTPNASTSVGCGSPTFTAPAGATSLSFTNGTIAAASGGAPGTCTISVDVTVPVTGTYTNTSNNLFIGTADTGVKATASLDVQAAGTPTGICGQNLATWNFEGLTLGNISPALTADSGSATTKTMTWPTPSTAPTLGLDARIEANSHPKFWSSNGWPTTAPSPLNNGNAYLQFELNPLSFAASMTFAAEYADNKGPTNMQLFTSPNGTTWTQLATFNPPSDKAPSTWGNFGPYTIPAGTTYIRIYGYGAANKNNSSDFDIDDVVFTGCGPAIQPALTKVFSPNPVAVGGESTLTFTLTNTNPAALTGVNFNDTLPAGLVVATVPSANASNCGSPSWAPAAGATELVFTGATIPAPVSPATSASCTVSVKVKATTAGPHLNVSGLISSTEGGTNATGNGFGTATLTALVPPTIGKAFSNGFINPGDTTTLSFIITNPNPANSLSGISFTDTYPSGLVNYTTPAATNTCGGTLTASAGGGSISLTNGSLAAGANCQITVVVTAPTGTYPNSVTVADTVAGTGNTSTDTLSVRALVGGISLLKQVSATGATGPWSAFTNVDTNPPPDNVWYRFTVENTGEIALSPVSVSDPRVAASGCTWPNPLPVAGPSTDPTATCVVGPIVAQNGLNPNTATASGVGGGQTYTDSNSASYLGAAPGFALLKEISTSASGPWSSAINIPIGANVYYRFTLSNTGTVTLSNPNVTDPTVTGVSACTSTFTNPLPVGGATFCIVGPVVASSTPNATVTNTAQGHGTPLSGPVVNTANSLANYTTSGNTVLTLVKSHTGNFLQGQSGATYTLTVGNTGSGATSGTITVTDALPVGMTFVSGGGTGGWDPCTASGQNVTCTSNSPIAASSASTITLTVNIASTAVSPLTNVAGASGGGATNTPTASDTQTWVSLGGTLFRDNGKGTASLSGARDGIWDTGGLGAEPNANVASLNNAYVVILDSAGLVLAVTPVCNTPTLGCASSGAWFAYVPAGTNYQAYITTAATAPLPTVGGTVADPQTRDGVPAGWLMTKGSVNNVAQGAAGTGLLTGISTATALSINFGCVSGSCPIPGL